MSAVQFCGATTVDQIMGVARRVTGLTSHPNVQSAGPAAVKALTRTATVRSTP